MLNVVIVALLVQLVSLVAGQLHNLVALLPLEVANHALLPLHVGHHGLNYGLAASLRSSDALGQERLGARLLCSLASLLADLPHRVAANDRQVHVKFELVHADGMITEAVNAA